MQLGVIFVSFTRSDKFDLDLRFRDWARQSDDAPVLLLIVCGLSGEALDCILVLRIAMGEGPGHLNWWDLFGTISIAYAAYSCHFVRGK